MGIGLDVVVFLRGAGHEAVHLTERRQQRIPDDQILAAAVAESRIVLTHDLDMGRLLAMSSATAPSVVTFRLSDMRPPSVIRHLAQAVEAFSTELEQGAVLTLTDSAARCHLLPLIRARGS
jgi:predicted nuclease of predicted toxin-antitoxin system